MSNKTHSLVGKLVEVVLPNSPANGLRFVVLNVRNTCWGPLAVMPCGRTAYAVRNVRVVE